MTELASVEVYPRRGDAEVAAAVLRAAGIDAIVEAEDEGGLNPGFYRSYGVRVSVRADELADARQLLGIETVSLPDEMATAMVQHARFVAPEEACGLLAVDDVGELRMVYALTNVDRSPRRFTVAPQEHFGALRHAEHHGWSIGGVFHSHPAGPAWPSTEDVAGALDPTWLYVVVGMAGPRPEIGAFRIRDGRVTSVRLRR